MTNADESEINLGVMLHKSWIWVEMLHSMFVLLTACMKVEVLKLSLRQIREEKTILLTTAEWNMSHERHKLLCHKIICVPCTLMPTAAEWSLYVGWSGWIICLNWLQIESAVRGVS